jgi:hypothetical protein
MAGELMKNKFLIGILILTIFLVSLIPASVGAINGSGFSGLKITGKGTASYGGKIAMIQETWNLRVTEISEEFAIGIGRGQLTLQKFDKKNYVSDHQCKWIFNRQTKTIVIKNVVGNHVFELAGIMEETSISTQIRFSVNLSGFLNLDGKTINLNFPTNIAIGPGIFPDTQSILS